MSNILITGCGGFIGSHLAELMLNKGCNVYGTIFDFDGAKNISHIRDKITLLNWDMKDKSQSEHILQQSKPDVIFHLAAQSFVIPSWEDPEGTLKTNIFGTMYLLDAARKLAPNATICVACSSAEYGFVESDEIPISEFNPLRPSSPYALSKIGQDMLSYLYWKAYGMKIKRMRFFNTTGPRKTFDACSDFARGIAEIEAGRKSTLKIGNLDGIRDITDVRDTVQAIDILAENAPAGEVYNICTGVGHRVGDLLDILLKMAKTKISLVVEPDTRRKIDDPIFIGDNTKVSKLGWKPEIPIEKTLSDMLHYWRAELA